jgi:hypothetical protein
MMPKSGLLFQPPKFTGVFGKHLHDTPGFLYIL